MRVVRNLSATHGRVMARARGATHLQCAKTEVLLTRLLQPELIPTEGTERFARRWLLLHACVHGEPRAPCPRTVHLHRVRLIFRDMSNRGLCLMLKFFGSSV